MSRRRFEVVLLAFAALSLPACDGGTPFNGGTNGGTKADAVEVPSGPALYQGAAPPAAERAAIAEQVHRLDYAGFAGAIGAHQHVQAWLRLELGVGQAA